MISYFPTKDTPHKTVDFRLSLKTTNTKQRILYKRMCDHVT